MSYVETSRAKLPGERGKHAQMHIHQGLWTLLHEADPTRFRRPATQPGCCQTCAAKHESGEADRIGWYQRQKDHCDPAT